MEEDEERLPEQEQVGSPETTADGAAPREERRDTELTPPTHADATDPLSERATPPLPMDEEDHPAVIETVLCAVCRGPIATVHDILSEEHNGVDEGDLFSTRKESVFCYPIDLFECGRPVMAYGAVNPSSVRFDLLRIATKVHCPSEEDASATDLIPSLVTFSGQYTKKHSFFVHHSWCYCHCQRCNHFLGWGFIHNDKVLSNTTETVTETVDEAPPSLPSPHDESDHVSEDTGNNSDAASDGEDSVLSLSAQPPPDFIGLIITKCTGDAAYPVSQLRKELDSASTSTPLFAQLEELKKTFFSIVGEIDGQPANGLLSIFQAVLRGVDNPPSPRDISMLRTTITHLIRCATIISLEQSGQRSTGALRSSSPPSSP